MNSTLASSPEPLLIASFKKQMKILWVSSEKVPEAKGHLSTSLVLCLYALILFRRERQPGQRTDKGQVWSAEDLTFTQASLNVHFVPDYKAEWI